MQKPVFLHATDAQKVLQGLGDCSSFQVDDIGLFDLVYLSPEVLLTDNVVISSQKTVQWLLKNEIVIEQLQGKNIFIVGEETTKGLRGLGLRPSFVSQKGFQGLTQHLDSCQVGTIVGATELALPANEWLNTHPHWNHVAVYQTTVKDDVEIQNVARVKVALITSPKIAKALYKKGLPTDVLVLTLGATTANTCTELGFQHVVIGKGSILKTCQWFVRQQETLLQNMRLGR